MNRRDVLQLMNASACATAVATLPPAKANAAESTAKPDGPRFVIRLPATLPASLPTAPFVTGRLLLLIARSGEIEPRLQLQPLSLFAVDVRQKAASDSIAIDALTPGYPEQTLAELPPGDYSAQAVLNVYTPFHRADGHVIWTHDDQWEGQNFRISPGNLCSKPQEIHLPEPSPIRLTLDEVIPPIERPADTEWVKHLKIQSKLLTQFWGRPIYIGATVLLPKGYAEHPHTRYPVAYLAGHFALGAPFHFDPAPDPPGFKSWARQRAEWIAEHPEEWKKGHLNMPEPPRQGPEEVGDVLDALRRRDGSLRDVQSGYEFYRAWNAEHYPRMIAVTLQMPTPYFDNASGVNSDTYGPYGDAVMQELIPYIEAQFRTIRASYARVLTGHSWGGWISLALQIFHPEFFGGTWSFCPACVDHRRWFGGVDLYDDDNIYAEKPGRYFSGSVQRAKNSDQLIQLSGRVNGWLSLPMGRDGEPLPLWDTTTGKINHHAVQYLKDHDFDLNDYLRRHWSRIGASLAGKLHVFCGDADEYYLDLSVNLLEDFLESTRSPYYAGSFTYGRPMKGHGWMPMTQSELVQIMAAHIARHEPPNVDIEWRSSAASISPTTMEDCHD
jgi:S-formylglutathione hydrolase FrmB